MASFFDEPANYLLANAELSKQMVLVAVIPGVDTLASTVVYKALHYGEPGIAYGAGYVYGQLIPVSGVRTILDLNGSSLTISQKIEPEQGRGSISTITLTFIDKNSYMTQVISPGIIVDEILGRDITLFLGYADISYPEDYIVIFRGKITGVSSISGRVTLQISDPNFNRRQQIFYIPTWALTGNINNSVTTIPTKTDDFFQGVLGPLGTYDSGVTLYAIVESEVMQYPIDPTVAFGTPGQITGVTRAQRSTAAAAHAIATPISPAIQVTDNPLIIALKLMLSGWNGPYITGVALKSFVNTTFPATGSVVNSITLPDNKDAVREYGLTVGDFVTITGATNVGNNVTQSKILSIISAGGYTNNVIVLNSALVLEYPTSATAAFRSQYDVYPVGAGSKLTPMDVDVAQHQYLYANFYSGYTFTFYITAQENSCKSFIEKEIYLPLGVYSVTKRGRLSVNATLPPFANQTLTFLTGSNIINPEQMKVERTLNNRKFFNEIDYDWDVTDDGQTFASALKSIDSTSLTLIGQSSVLPIKSRGATTTGGGAQLFSKASLLLLNRYKRGATMISIKVNWGVGNIIEGGDIVALQDNGILQLSNFATGVRNLGTQLFEVIDRTLNIKEANVSLTLISGLQGTVSDRFASWSPASLVRAGSTTTVIPLSDSFGSNPGQEILKWVDYVGYPVLVHSYDWTNSSASVITAVDTVNTTLTVSPALSYTPSLNDIVDIDKYPTSTDPNLYSLFKLLFCYFDPQITITNGISATQFQVGAGDVAKFQLGLPVTAHNANYSNNDTNEPLVTLIAGTTITVASPGFSYVPATNDKIELVGWPDLTQPYRFI